MTDDELAIYMKFARRMAKSYPQRSQDDIEGYAGLGVAHALASSNLPSDTEGRRKFIGATVRNWVVNGVRFLSRKQPVPFTDLGFAPDLSEIDSGFDAVDDRDEIDSLLGVLCDESAVTLRRVLAGESVSEEEINNLLAERAASLA